MTNQPSAEDRRRAESLKALIRWYSDAGIDIAVDELPHDRFKDQLNALQAARACESGGARPAASQKTVAARQEKTQTNPLNPVPRQAMPLAPGLAAQAAWDTAREANSLEELRQRLETFEGCGLKATATRLVFGDGGPQSDVMFIGEAPGADEDRQGIPFVGRAGQLLNAMLASIGLERKNVYIANIVPWRPPGNRTPSPLETAACLPFISRQIELVAPKILVCLGAPSAQTLLESKEGITRLRGRWHSYNRGGTQIQAAAMLHPAFLLRQPLQKRRAWQDLRMLSKAICAMLAKS